MIYLDYAANTPVAQEVLDAFCAAAAAYPGNPNSPHPAGLEAKARLDAATAEIAALLGVQNDEIIYTSGASESNNLAIKGAAQRYKRFGRHIVTTMLEHSSVNGPVGFLQNEGFEVEYVGLDKNGQVDLDELQSLLRDDTILVSVCAVDSELGICQQTKRIGALAHTRPHCLFHSDLTQAVGKLPVSFENVDLATFAPHKFYGLNGCGVLIKKQPVMLEPQIHGGVSTTAFRSGTPALALIASLQAALAAALRHQEERMAYVTRLNHALREEFASRPALHVNSPRDASPYILNASVAGGKADALQDELARRVICVATKSACCAPKTVSRPVFALTHDKKAALSTLRVSLSHLTTQQELDAFLAALDDGLRALQ